MFTISGDGPTLESIVTKILFTCIDPVNHLMLLVEDEFRADFCRCLASDGSDEGIEIRPIKLGYKSETVLLWRSEDQSGF